MKAAILALFVSASMIQVDFAEARGSSSSSSRSSFSSSRTSSSAGSYSSSSSSKKVSGFKKSHSSSSHIDWDDLFEDEEEEGCEIELDKNRKPKIDCD